MARAIRARMPDSRFSIWASTLGALLSQILCPLLADMIGWWAGFLAAAIGMVLSWAGLQFDGGRLAAFGNPPKGLV